MNAKHDISSSKIIGKRKYNWHHIAHKKTKQKKIKKNPPTKLPDRGEGIICCGGRNAEGDEKEVSQLKSNKTMISNKSQHSHLQGKGNKASETSKLLKLVKKSRTSKNIELGENIKPMNLIIS